MSERKNIAIKNSMVGLGGQVISLVLQIISRKVFIKYIGEDLLGLNGTFSSILSTLSLAEFGFQNAISFGLYKPLANRDISKVNQIVNVFRIVYRYIGIFFIVVSFAILPILKYFTKDIQFTNDMYIFFLIQAASSACTYFLAYKRTILYADQKEYVYKITDTILSVSFKSAQIYIVIFYHNYYAYLILQLMQVYVSNLIVHFICVKRYPYLKKECFDIQCAKDTLKNAKDIFAGRIAGYVYSATDNIIISSMNGTGVVAFLGNYSALTTNIRLLIISMLGPLTPIIGNYMAENNHIMDHEDKFNIYSHIRYIIALVLLVPTMVLMDDFIRMWLGEQYVMSWVIKVFLIIDIYIFLLYGSCSDYIVGAGLFKQDKYITIMGATLNLIISALLAKPFGVAGVLFGTICNQMVYWIGRSIIVFRLYFKYGWLKYILYVLKNVIYIVCFSLFTALCMYVYSIIPMMACLLKFIIGGFICESIIFVLYLLIFSRTHVGRECQQMISPLQNKILRFRRKKEKHE